VTLDRRFELLVSEAELVDWREAAAADGISLGAWVRRCCKGELDVRRAIARNDAVLERQARRLHELPPHVARDLLERSVPPERWPDPAGGEQA
jgi:hypothetical protein